MSKRQTMKVTVTMNPDKLWRCTAFKNNHEPKFFGKLPIAAGEEIVLFLPGETPSPFCQARRAWDVAVPPKSLKNPVGYKVCEHQIDLPRKRKP